jgi:hypothetical protein
MTMTRNIALAALSAAIVLGSVSASIGATKKPNDARQAYGSADAGAQMADPRDAYWARRKKGNDLTWCDMDEKCNGWAEWLEDVNSGKIKNH